MKQQKGISIRDLSKQKFDNPRLRAQTPPRAGARMQPPMMKRSGKKK